MRDFQRIKERYSVIVPIETINGISIVAVNELDLKWLIEQVEKDERSVDYIGQLEHEKQLLYGRLNMIRDLVDKKIE